MNILIPSKWLKEIVETDLEIEKLIELLTLRSSSVEKITKIEDDYVLDIEVPPNRGDTLSVLGIARELCAILQIEGFKTQFNNPLENIYKIGKEAVGSKKLDISIENNEISSRFTAIVLGNLDIKNSPEFIKQRLRQVGIRPINNIVDITNYAMIETGSPMHAFDYDQVSGGTLNIRLSKKGEKITTLDGVNRLLPTKSIIIEDNSKIIDLCGIMGGNNSKISPKTKNIVIFAPVYNPNLIRKTSLKLNHRTDAALRFEKGVDPGIQKLVLLRSLKLLEQSTSFVVDSKIYDIGSPNNVLSKKVSISFKKLNIYAGEKLKKSIVEKALTTLGFKITEKSREKTVVKVPSHRITDINIEEDLIEEVIRIYGYEKIGLELPKNFYINDTTSAKFKFERIVKSYLRDVGYHELLTYSFVSADMVNIPKAVKIKNPLNENMTYLRTSLEPSLKKALLGNTGVVKVFELANVYQKVKNGLPKETYKLGILDNSSDSVFQLKNRVNNILKLLNIRNVEMIYDNDDRYIKIVSNNTNLGQIKINADYSYLSLDYESLISLSNELPLVELPSNNDIIIEDLTVHIKPEDHAGVILQKIQALDECILDVKLKDDYKKNNMRAVTFTIFYQDKKKNLDKESVGVIRNNIIEYLEQDLKLVIDRDYDQYHTGR